MGRFVGDMDWRRFVPGYLALLVVVVAASFGLDAYLGVPGERAILGLSSVLFIAAAAMGPRGYLFRLVRNVGWFSGIEQDRNARRVLLVIAVGLLIAYVWQSVR